MKKILLLEDELILGETMFDVLEMYGHEVVWAKTITEFVGCMKNYKTFDLICSDFHLPDGTLIDVWNILQNCQDSFNIPLLVMSATASEEDRHFIDRNIEYVLYKPFAISDLNLLIKNILDG